MKIRVIDYSTYEEWYEEQMVEGKQKNLSQLTDADFMYLYNQEDRDWEFDEIMYEVTYRLFEPIYHEVKVLMSKDKGYALEKKVRKSCLKY